MRVPRLAVYGLLLAACLVGGALVGAAVGPEPPPGSTPHTEAHGGEDGGDDGGARAVAAKGLAVTEAGYTLEADDTVLAPGTTDFRFRIVGPGGAPIQRFTTQHDKPLHLIAVSRDLGFYAHVHPTLDSGGTWSVPLQGLRPGAHRVFADFKPADGPALTLGIDVTVPGDYRPPAPPEPVARTSVDGFDVELSGALRSGASGPVSLTVTRSGRAVGLEPYLGANGHLVAIRTGDLAYLHVHPMDEEARAAAGSVPFGVEVPSAGRYRMFFDFKVDGVVRTAAFTVDAQSHGH